MASHSVAHTQSSSLLDRAAPHLPRILQPSLWETVFPSTLRSKTRSLFSEQQRKPRNPATYFIWIYLLIGSQAIRIIQVKNEHNTFARKAEIQIEKLREVVRRLQAGEDVDVEKVLGTGVPEEEEAWEEALKEIENEERLWSESKKKKRQQREQRKKEAEEAQQREQDASPVNQIAEPVKTTETASSSSPPFRNPTFY
ncbi:hypothetical protein LTR64_007434 [Lithohypha guttulata]|uniref:uncharacterized protein n=1 Tax=Lithohypha guttulata TaxID=1690604 RepID=UPI002DDE145F|nr:hypothetical protein LTR51_006801 [Lithohypha guttulata]